MVVGCEQIDCHQAAASQPYITLISTNQLTLQPKAVAVMFTTLTLTTCHVRSDNFMKKTHDHQLSSLDGLFKHHYAPMPDCTQNTQNQKEQL